MPPTDDADLSTRAFRRLGLEFGGLYQLDAALTLGYRVLIGQRRPREPVVNFARLIARIVIGGLFVGHGMQKLAGWFGGPGLENTEGMMKSLRLHPPRHNAIAAGAAETGGGTLLALGLATPVASSALIGTMITAIRKVHWSNGPWVAAGGYEYNLVLIAALMALAEDKPGDISADHALGLHFTGFRWSLAALAAGAAASAATVWLGESAAPQDPEAADLEEGETPTEEPGDPTTA